MGWQDDQVVSPPNWQQDAPAGQPSMPDRPSPTFDEKGQRVWPPGAEPPPSTLQEIKTAAGGVPGMVNKAVETAGTQFTKGINQLIGLPNTLSDLGMEAMSKLRGVPNNPPPGTGHVMPTTADANRFVFGSLGVPERNMPSMPFQPAPGGPTVDLGKAADAGLQAIPTFGGSGLWGALPGFASGAGSELAGQAAAGTPYEPIARVAGGGAGYLAGAKAVTPLPAKLTPNEARAVEIAKSNEVPLSVSQETGRGQMLERIAGRFPTGHAPFEKLHERQATAADRAAIEAAGVKGVERTDPESMKIVAKEAKSNFGSALNQVGDVTLDPSFYQKAGAANATYHDVMPQSGVAPVVQKTFNDFFDPKLIKGGPMPQLSSEEFQSFRKNIGDTMQGLNPGAPEFKALKKMREALDDAMVASAPADKAAAMTQARREYANYKIIAKSAGGGTVASRSEGNLSPSALTTSLKRAQGDKFSETTGGLNDIATLKQYLADTFPNSGTPTVGAGHAMMGGGAMLAGEHGVGLLHDPKMMAAMAALLAGPRMTANALTGQGKILAPLLHKYLVNQAMVKANPGLYGGGMKSLPFSLAPGIAVSVPPLLEGRQ